MLELYTNIKKRRLELNMTQQELAEQIGYTSGKSMIAKIEKGDVDLTQSKIKQFADALHTTPSHLMGWEIEAEPIPEEHISERVARLSKYSVMIAQLPSSEQDMILSVIDAMLAKYTKGCDSDVKI